MEVIAIVIGIIGLVGTVVFGIKSKHVSDAFARYVDLEDEVNRLERSTHDYQEKVNELEQVKASLYRHAYKPKTKVFVPGDKVRLIEIPEDRCWISEHSKVGMTGIVVDYGPGTYEYTVYWSEADYEGQPIDEYENRWQPFCVNKEQIERIE